MYPGEKWRGLAERAKRACHEAKRTDPLVVLYLLSIWSAIIQMNIEHDTSQHDVHHIVRVHGTACGNMFDSFSLIARCSHLRQLHVHARKRKVHIAIEIEMHPLYTISCSYSVPCYIYASSAERTSDPTNEWRTTATAAATKNKQVYNEKRKISYVYLTSQLSPLYLDLYKAWRHPMTHTNTYTYTHFIYVGSYVQSWDWVHIIA